MAYLEPYSIEEIPEGTRSWHTIYNAGMAIISSAMGTWMKVPLAGENIAIREVCYIGADGKAYKARANADGTMPAVGFARAAATTGNPVVLQSASRLTGFSSLTIGAEYYVSSSTAGAITSTRPGGVNHVQLMGVAMSAIELNITPMWSPDRNTAVTLQDADIDTSIQVEATADEDIIRFTRGGTEVARMIAPGRLGINCTDPGHRLDVQRSYAGMWVLARLRNDQAAATEQGPLFAFGAMRTTSGLTNVAAVGGTLTDIGDATYKGALVFYTADAGAVAEKARLDAKGNLGLGKTSFGTNAEKVIALALGVQPGSLADTVQVFCGDYAADHACLHIVNEDGDLIKLEQQAHIIDSAEDLAELTTKFNTLLAELENTGLLAGA